MFYYTIYFFLRFFHDNLATLILVIFFKIRGRYLLVYFDNCSFEHFPLISLRRLWTKKYSLYKLWHIPWIFHENQIIFQPMNCSLRFRGNKAGQLQRFTFGQSNILWFFTEEWNNSIYNLLGDGFLSRNMSQKFSKVSL